MLQTTNKRIDYIDTIRGFSILWVVIFHLGDLVPSWVGVHYRMPLFFFVSGIFFRLRPFKQFFVKRINTLIIPFLFFLLISLLFAGARHYTIKSLFPHITDTGVSINYITNLVELFTYRNHTINHPLIANEPLWFLLGLFFVQMIFYWICKINCNKVFRLCISAVISVIGLVLQNFDIQGPLYLPQATEFLIYYAAGSIVGPYLIEYIEKTKNEFIVLVISFPLLLSLSLAQYQDENAIALNLFLFIRIICFIPIVFIFFKEYHQFTLFRPLRFFGHNSLILLGTHGLFIVIFSLTLGPFLTKLLHTEIPTNIRGMLIFFMVLTINYFLILFFNRFLPWFVGKKEIIPSNRLSDRYPIAEKRVAPLNSNQGSQVI